MSEPDEGFRVTDRRGRSRDAAEADRPGGTREPARAAPPSGPVPAEPEARAAPNLVGLFVMLAHSALVALGESPDPATGARQVELAQAAELIDLLMVLREKTEGRRSTEESQVLGDLIHDLQVRYVSVARRSGSPPAPPRP